MKPYSSLLPAGVRRLFRLPRSRDHIARDLDDEMRTHVAMRIDELHALGMTEADARAEALRRFGDADEFRVYVERRASRQARRGRWLDGVDEWTQDLRFAGRQFRKNAGLTALIVLTLGLGIGANTAIFTVVHRVLIAPLPYPDGDRIVMLAMEDQKSHGMTRPEPQAMHAWRGRARSLESLAAVSIDYIMVQDAAERDTIHASITSNYMRLLGIHPVLGRDFTADEERPGATVAIISYGLWQRTYGGRSDALGKKVHVNRVAHTIVGVAPIEMGLPISYSTRGTKFREATPSIWLPTSLDSLEGSDTFARLRPGVTAAGASKELQGILDGVPLPQTRAGFPRDQNRCCARAVRAQDMLSTRETRTIEVLFVAVGALLLIACANVANLLMARAWTRRREFAVRSALGAGRARLARLVLTESVFLALAGGGLGVVLAWQTLKAIVALRPPSLSNLDGMHVEAPVLAWCVAVSVITGILFGSVPALVASAGRVGDVLRSETRAGSGDTRSRRVRSSLIVLEIALSLVLLVGAGLLVRSFIALERMPLGFDPHGLASVDVMFPRAKRPDRPAQQQAVLARLRTIPGVTEASIGVMPGEAYGVFGPSSRLETEPDASGQTQSVQSYRVTFMSPNYFRVARMSLLEGRAPEADADAPPPGPGPLPPPSEMVVSRATARRLWPRGGAVGNRLRAPSSSGSIGAGSTVVGVVEDVNMPGASPEFDVQTFQPPVPLGETPFVVRASVPPDQLVPALRHAVLDANPANIVYTITVGEHYLRDAMAPTTFAMALLAAFSAIALLLSAVGLYGVIAYAVTQRTREIGIRVALGAEPWSVARLVVGGGIKLAIAGAVVGAVVAAAAARVLSGLLYGVSANDPLTFASIVSLVVAIALLACWVPANRAVRIDPTVALRAE